MIRRPPRSTPTYTPFPDPTLLRPPPLGRPRARRAIGLAQVQDRPLAVRAGRIMAHSNIIPPLDRSPESHASAWPVSAWDGRGSSGAMLNGSCPPTPVPQGDPPSGFGMPASGDLETRMTSHQIRRAHV